MSLATAMLALSSLTILALPVVAAEYVVTADTMQSDDGIFVFTGEVAIVSDGLELAAEELTVQNDIYQISGSPAKLVLRDKGVATTAHGSFMTYDSKNELLEIAQGGGLTQGDLEILAGTIKFNVPGQHLEAYGSVRITGAELAGRGDSAVSSGSKDKLVLILTGEPAQLDLASDDGQELNASASRIEISQVERQVQMKGSAQAILGPQNVSGDVIKYDLERSAFVVLPDKGGRVRAVIKTQ